MSGVRPSYTFTPKNKGSSTRNYENPKFTIINKEKRGLKPLKSVLKSDEKFYISLGKRPNDRSKKEMRVVKEIKDPDDPLEIRNSAEQLLQIYRSSTVLCSCISNCLNSLKSCCNGNKVKVEGKII